MQSKEKSLKNTVFLITYPDSLGDNLQDLQTVMDTYLKRYVGGIHILPFYPSSADRGFSPLTHREVDPTFGTWEDIKNLSKKYVLMADFVVNHISAESEFFQDYLQKGKKSKYAEYFITGRKFSRRILPHREYTPRVLDCIESLINTLRHWDKVFHTQGVNKRALKKVYRPRPESPFVAFDFPDGTRNMWCTFTKDQIDFDIYNKGVQRLLKKFMRHLAKNGVTFLRLDAVGYIVKKRGTTSFMIPETYDFIRLFAKIAHKEGMKILPEIHNHYQYQLELAKMRVVDYVYDFQLPLLTLHTLYTRDATALKNWIAIRPHNAITMLDAHDGIPIVDLEDLLTQEQIDQAKQTILTHGGNEVKRASTGEGGIEVVDTYQVNCTYYAAVGEDDDAYIVARAIQLFIPGVPQVYYDGLFAGVNDFERMRETQVGREILRHGYTLPEIKQAMQKKVVKRLLKMIKFRNTYPIFDGKFRMKKSDKNTLLFTWRKENLFLHVMIDLKMDKVDIHYKDKKSDKERIMTF